METKFPKQIMSQHPNFRILLWLVGAKRLLRPHFRNPTLTGHRSISIKKNLNPKFIGVSSVNPLYTFSGGPVYKA